MHRHHHHRRQFEIRGDLVGQANLGWEKILGDDKLWNEIGPDPGVVSGDAEAADIAEGEVPELFLSGDPVGDLLGWNPFRSAGHLLERGAKGAGRFAGSVATLPVRMAVNVVKGAGSGIYHGIRPSGGGGGRGGGGGGGDGGGAPSDDGGSPADGGDGGDESAGLYGLGLSTFTPASRDGMYYMSGREAMEVSHVLRRLPPRARRPAAQMFIRRWGIAGIKIPDPTKHPMGKLLVSATPGGVSALAAKQIAAKALKNGNLKPGHLKKAGELTKAGRKGDPKALTKIAAIKAKAGRGDPAAEKALDTIKIAQCVQTGRYCGPTTRGGGLPGALRRLRRVGEATIHWGPRRG
jgi:hypothetical protein